LSASFIAGDHTTPRDEPSGGAGVRRIDDAGSVHDEEEIEAVLEVLRGPPTALRIGRKTRELEAGVAELFGKGAFLAAQGVTPSA
jgi:hypothetical protein